MGFISPSELNQDRKLWLSVPHELHEVLYRLMLKLYPDFNLNGIHCLECEGKQPFIIIDKNDLKLKLCTGYIKQGDEITLLRLTELKPRRS